MALFRAVTLTAILPRILQTPKMKMKNRVALLYVRSGATATVDLSQRHTNATLLLGRHVSRGGVSRTTTSNSSITH